MEESGQACHEKRTEIILKRYDANTPTNTLKYMLKKLAKAYPACFSYGREPTSLL